jgi:hypothetical protein
MSEASRRTPDPATPGDMAETRARRMLSQLAEADAKVRCFPEPRSGPLFESVQRTWSALYARALALGNEFAEDDISGGRG